MFSWDEVAKQSYEAYAGVTDWKNFQGNPMPQWDELPGKIREAWIAASKQACRSLKTVDSETLEYLLNN